MSRLGFIFVLTRRLSGRGPRAKRADPKIRLEPLVRRFLNDSLSLLAEFVKNGVRQITEMLLASELFYVVVGYERAALR